MVLVVILRRVVGGKRPSAPRAAPPTPLAKNRQSLPGSPAPPMKLKGHRLLGAGDLRAGPYRHSRSGGSSGCRAARLSKRARAWSADATVEERRGRSGPVPGDRRSFRSAGPASSPAHARRGTPARMRQMGDGMGGQILELERHRVAGCREVGQRMPDRHRARRPSGPSPEKRAHRRVVDEMRSSAPAAPPPSPACDPAGRHQ